MLLAMVLSLAACSKDAPPADNPIQPESGYFDFATTGKRQLSLHYDVPQGYRVYFEVYDRNPLHTEEGYTSLRTDLKALTKGYTDASGRYEEWVTLPTSVEEIWVYSPFIAVAPLLHGTFAGERAALSEADAVDDEQASDFAQTRAAVPADHIVLGSWTNKGRPHYLSDKDKVTISGGQLTRLNNVFNEGRPVSKIYFQASDIHVTEPANINLNFIAASTSAQNVLGYYCYKTGEKPESPDRIANRVIVFPRVSTTAVTQKALVRGESVKLRYIDQQGVDHGYDFPEGVSIGWFLYNAGYNTRNGNITVGEGQFYSDPDLNVTEKAQEKNHVALFKLDDMIFLGFEDWFNNQGDGDCNDCIFQVSANPIQSIDTNIPDAVEPDDTDEAYSIEYEGTLAFEDNWPSYGDYDMNDLVIRYHATTWFTRFNEAVRTEDRFTLLWMGGAYRNGFGYMLHGGHQRHSHGNFRGGGVPYRAASNATSRKSSCCFLTTPAAKQPTIRSNPPMRSTRASSSIFPGINTRPHPTTPSSPSGRIEAMNCTCPCTPPRQRWTPASSDTTSTVRSPRKAFTTSPT